METDGSGKTKEKEAQMTKKSRTALSGVFLLGGALALVGLSVSLLPRSAAPQAALASRCPP